MAVAGSDMKASGERGAALTFVTAATAAMILSMATVYLSGATDAYKLSAFRAQEAKVLAAADGALAEAIVRFEQDRTKPFEMDLARDGIRIRVASVISPEAQVVVTATGGGDERTPIIRKLTAGVDLGPPGALRVTRIRRE